jgi:hypothetical protein
MEPQYDMIRNAVAWGGTVLCYNRKATHQRIRRITLENFSRRVAMVDRVLTIDGIIALGWTFAVKQGKETK